MNVDVLKLKSNPLGSRAVLQGQPVQLPEPQGAQAPQAPRAPRALRALRAPQAPAGLASVLGVSVQG